jgi:HK97 family phage major capsid protein
MEPKISELRRKLAAASDELTALTEDAAAFDLKLKEIEALEGQIERAEIARKRSAALSRPAGSDPRGEDPAVAEGADFHSIARMASELGAIRARGATPSFHDAVAIARRSTGWTQDASRHFRNLGEQLLAVKAFAESRGSSQDARLVRAPTGAGETDPTGGGFLLQMDFASAVWMLAHDLGEVLGAVNKIPISTNANSLTIPGVDETSRANGSRWGGVSVYMAGEGSGGTAAAPKFRDIVFKLNKMIGLYYATDELLADAPAFSAVASQAFAEEITFKAEDLIYRGLGDGQPLGVLKSPALITVAKQNGQASGTIIKENIDQMYAQCYARSLKNAKWYINQLCYPQLFSLAQVVGTGGAPVYLPPGGLSGSPFGTLYGRPVVPVEYAEAPGTVGDIMLADFSQYTLVDKGGVQAAMSMHVAFLTDQQVFRITYRLDGKPMWPKPLTPYKGAVPLGPFVALAAR